MTKILSGGIAVLLSVATLTAAGDLRLVNAARNKDRDAVRALVKQRVDVHTPQGDGTTALAWAAHWDDPEMADLLIGAGAAVDAANDYGVTPLWEACNNASGAMVETFGICSISQVVETGLVVSGVEATSIRSISSLTMSSLATSAARFGFD